MKGHRCCSVTGQASELRTGYVTCRVTQSQKAEAGSNPRCSGQTLHVPSRLSAASPIPGFVLYSKAGVLVWGDDEMRSLNCLPPSP